jgi:hypothetical protein
MRPVGGHRTDRQSAGEVASDIRLRLQLLRRLGDRRRTPASGRRRLNRKAVAGGPPETLYPGIEQAQLVGSAGRRARRYSKGHIAARKTAGITPREVSVVSRTRRTVETQPVSCRRTCDSSPCGRY